MDYRITMRHGTDVIGSFSMNADCDKDAHERFTNADEFYQIMQSLSDEIDRSNINVIIENQYLENLDVTMKLSGTAECNLKPANIHHINPGVMIYKDKNGNHGYLHADISSADIRITGTSSFEADLSGKKIPESILSLPDIKEMICVPLYIDSLPGTFEIDVKELTISVVDKNKDRGNEMCSWGEPSYDKDGNAVYQVTFDDQFLHEEAMEDFTKTVLEM